MPSFRSGDVTSLPFIFLFSFFYQGRAVSRLHSRRLRHSTRLEKKPLSLGDDPPRIGSCPVSTPLSKVLLVVAWRKVLASPQPAPLRKPGGHPAINKKKPSSQRPGRSRFHDTQCSFVNCKSPRCNSGSFPAEYCVCSPALFSRHFLATASPPTITSPSFHLISTS